MVIPHLKRCTQIQETGGLIDALIRLTLLSQLPGLSIQSLSTRPGLSEIRMPLLLHPMKSLDIKVFVVRESEHEQNIQKFGGDIVKY